MSLIETVLHKMEEMFIQNRRIRRQEIWQHKRMEVESVVEREQKKCWEK